MSTLKELLIYIDALEDEYLKTFPNSVIKIKETFAGFRHSIEEKLACRK